MKNILNNNNNNNKKDRREGEKKTRILFKINFAQTAEPDYINWKRYQLRRKGVGPGLETETERSAFWVRVCQ